MRSWGRGRRGRRRSQAARQVSGAYCPRMDGRRTCTRPSLHRSCPRVAQSSGMMLWRSIHTTGGLTVCQDTGTRRWAPTCWKQPSANQCAQQSTFGPIANPASAARIPVQLLLQRREGQTDRSTGCQAEVVLPLQGKRQRLEEQVEGAPGQRYPDRQRQNSRLEAKHGWPQDLSILRRKHPTHQEVVSETDERARGKGRAHRWRPDNMVVLRP
jgi:hypothetical protein